MEVLIVVCIMTIISSIGAGFYVNYNKGVEIDSAVQVVVFDLKQAQGKSMIGEGGFKWGIHFVNAADDYYEIFSTPTDYSSGSKVILSTNYLIYLEPYRKYRHVPKSTGQALIQE